MQGRTPKSWLIGGCACVLACDTLYGLDTPRPALGDHDTFQVVPACADLPIDPSGLALVPTVITMTGLRADLGLGAESVPVAVRIGRCDSPDGAAGAPSEAAAGAAGNVPASSAGAGGADSEPDVACTGAGQFLSNLDFALFELTALEARGCRQRSPAVLECTLDANGEAAFGVVSRLQDDFNVNGALPICVTPFESSTRKQTQVAVVPRAGASRVALAVVELDEEGDGAPLIPLDTSCESALDCSQVSARARFQIGVVSRDIPAEAIRRSDFRPVTRNVVLTAEQQVLSQSAASAAPFISTDPSCRLEVTAGEGGQASDAEPSKLDLHIDSGQRASEVFYLCASSFGAEVEITTTLVDGGAAAPVIVPRTASLLALTQRYRAVSEGTKSVLFSQACGAELQVVTSGIPDQPGVVHESGRVLLTCDTTDPGAGGAGSDPVDAAGAPSAGAASAGAPSGGSGPGPQPTSSCSLSLDVGPAGKCILQVGN